MITFLRYTAISEKEHQKHIDKYWDVDWDSIVLWCDSKKHEECIKNNICDLEDNIKDCHPVIFQIIHSITIGKIGDK